MFVRAVDDKPSDTLVVVSGYGFWTGSSTLPHLHHEAWYRCPVSFLSGRPQEGAAPLPRSAHSETNIRVFHGQRRHRAGIADPKRDLDVDLHKRRRARPRTPALPSTSQLDDLGTF